MATLLDFFAYFQELTAARRAAPTDDLASEIANARVVDLTRRLIAANERIVTLQREADRSRVELAELRATHDAMRSSAAFRIADKIWTLRNVLRV